MRNDICIASLNIITGYVETAALPSILLTPTQELAAAIPKSRVHHHLGQRICHQRKLKACRRSNLDDLDRYQYQE